MTTKEGLEDTNYTPCAECGQHLIARVACETCLDADLDDAFQAGVRQGRNMLLADLYQQAWNRQDVEDMARLEALGPICFAHCIACGALSDGNPTCMTPACRKTAEARPVLVTPVDTGLYPSYVPLPYEDRETPAYALLTAGCRPWCG